MDRGRRQSATLGRGLGLAMGFLGVFSNFATGDLRPVLLVVALAGLIVALLIGLHDWRGGLLVEWVKDWWETWHYQADISHYDATFDVNQPDGTVEKGVVTDSRVLALLYLPNRKHSDTTQLRNRLLHQSGLRCEVAKRGLRGKRTCSDLISPSPGIIRGEFPPEYTEVANGRRRVANGPVVVRWKVDGRLRALARRTARFSDKGYGEHRMMAFLHLPRSLTRRADTIEARVRNGN
jgi:hypothetical protein